MKLQRHLFHLMGMVLIVAFLAAGAWIIVCAVQPASRPNIPEKTASPSLSPSAASPDDAVSGTAFPPETSFAPGTAFSPESTFVPGTASSPDSTFDPGTVFSTEANSTSESTSTQDTAVPPQSNLFWAASDSPVSPVTPLSPQSTPLQDVPDSPAPPSDSPAPSPTATNPMEGGVLNWLKELFTRLN